MNGQRIVGIILIIVGVVLLIVGINASDSVADRLSNFFTGQFTESTVWLMIGGGALMIGGLTMAVLGGGRGPKV